MSNLLVYNPEIVTGSYGIYVCPHCEACFYGGGPAMHEGDCPETARGHEGCVYHFGDRQVAAVIERSKRGEQHTPDGLSIAKLEENGFGYLIKRLTPT